MRTFSDTIPVYHFGSPELDALHRQAKVMGNVYGSDWHGFEYVVDHGRFRTLNELRAGQVVPRSRTISERGEVDE